VKDKKPDATETTALRMSKNEAYPLQFPLQWRIPRVIELGLSD
jgi:hypothetical protein